MRFGIIMSSLSTGVEWRESALAYEAKGFDYIHIPDHIGGPDPFVAASSIALVTERVRVGTLVLNAEFWNPLLLARAAATTQLLAEGRFQLGLGAGHAQVEFEQAGIPYPRPSARVRRLEAMARILPRLVAGETVEDDELGLGQASLGLPQTSLPLLVGGNGDGVLGVAGRYADMVSLVGFTSGTGQVHSNRSHWSWQGLLDRVECVRRAARGRPSPPEVHVLIQFAEQTADPIGAVTRWWGSEPPADYLDSPFVLVGDEAHINDHLVRLSQMGVTAISVFEESASTIEQLIIRDRQRDDAIS
jgi:probable F420-dependent oxidoreductase